MMPCNTLWLHETPSFQLDLHSCSRAIGNPDILPIRHLQAHNQETDIA